MSRYTQGRPWRQEELNRAAERHPLASEADIDLGVDFSRCVVGLTLGCRDVPVAVIVTDAAMQPLCARHYRWVADILRLDLDPAARRDA